MSNFSWSADCKATFGDSETIFKLATGSPGELGMLEKLADAYARIAKAKSAFLSRGDNSGTHTKEMAIWQKAGIEPGSDWYLITKDFMMATLKKPMRSTGIS